MVEVVKTLSGLLNPNVLVENIYAFTVLTVFLTMYGPRLHMRLPPSLMELFDSMLFRAAILFLIVYMSNRDFVGALTIVIIFTVTMNILHTNDVLKNVSSAVVNSFKTSEGILSNSLDTSVNAVHDIADLGVNIVDHGTDLAVNTSSNTGSVVHNTLNNVTGLVGNTLENVNNVVTNTAQNTADAVKYSANSMAGIVDVTGNLAANTVGDVAGLAANTVSGVSGLATSTASNIIGTVGDISSDIVGLAQSSVADTASLIDNTLNVEHFSASGPPVSKCAAYDNSNKTSNVHYPLNDNTYAENLRGGNNSNTLYNSTF